MKDLAYTTKHYTGFQLAKNNKRGIINTKDGNKWGDDVKKKMKIIIVVLVILMLVLDVWYHIPVKVEKTFYACTVGGKKSKIICNISWQRYIFDYDDLDGIITVDGVRYYSVRIDYQNLSLKDMIRENLDHKRNNSYYTKDKIGLEKFQNMIILSVDDIKFSHVNLELLNDNAHDDYYGPSNTAGEAESIRRRFLSN